MRQFYEKLLKRNKKLRGASVAGIGRQSLPIGKDRSEDFVFLLRLPSPIPRPSVVGDFVATYDLELGGAAALCEPIG